MKKRKKTKNRNTSFNIYYYKCISLILKPINYKNENENERVQILGHSI